MNFRLYSVTENILDILNQEERDICVEDVAHSLNEKSPLINLALSELLCAGIIDIEVRDGKNYIRNKESSPNEALSNAHSYQQLRML